MPSSLILLRSVSEHVCGSQGLDLISLMRVHTIHPAARRAPATVGGSTMDAGAITTEIGSYAEYELSLAS